MSTKAFTILICCVVGVCLLFTMAHFFYAVYAYQHCSIIEFVSRELW